MNTWLKILLTAAPVAATSSWLTTALQQEPGAQEPAGKPAHEMTEMEVMQKMMEYGTPGEKHAELAEAAGDWNIVMKMRMGPDAPWQTTEGSSTSKMTLGGRYLVEQTKFDFMGQESKGILFLGFDNLTETYQSVWMDSWGTRMMYSEGKENDEGHVVFKGMMKDFITPKGRPYRMVSRDLSNDQFVLEMWDTIPKTPDAPMPKEPNVKVMEMTYTRASAQ